jgi:tyramine---L-glutamate ligase
MRIFVYEHMSSGELTGKSGAESLRREGLAMLQAVLQDLCGCRDAQPVVLVESTVMDTVHAEAPRAEIHACDSATNELLYRQLAGSAGFALVIAPEFDNLLEDRCRWALAEGSRLLGPSPAAVRLCADKLALADHLTRQGVPTPCTAPYGDDDPPWPFPVVCKPRFGAGSQHTRCVHNRTEYAVHGNRSSAQAGSLAEGIVQPFIKGTPASVVFLAGCRKRIALPAARQYLSEDGCFSYQGGKVPLEPTLLGRAHDLAGRAADAFDGLDGYFGVDLVLGQASDGSDDAVIEINPRLTTSHVGLRRLSRGNLMQTLLDLAVGMRPEPLEWYDKAVSFHPDGRID